MMNDMQLGLEAYCRACNEQIESEKQRIEASTTRLLEANETLSELRGQLEDRIKERTAALEQSQEQLRQSENMAAIGKIASLLAHEIRNPLSSVVLNLELLSDELESYAPEDTREAKGLLESVSAEVNRINRNTREYLAISRAPSVQLSPADLNSVVQGQLAFLRAELGQASVRLELSLDDDLRSVMLDAEQFRQVLLNLIKNSLDAMAGGGVLRISTERDGALARVVVQDEGEGMSEAGWARIFEPLFTTKTKGLGMGLSFVQEVITAHGGDISCSSREGDGTTFTITLPAS